VHTLPFCRSSPYFNFHLSFYISSSLPSQGPCTLIYLLAFRIVLNPLAYNIILEMSTRAFKEPDRICDTSLFSIHENVLIVQLVRLQIACINLCISDQLIHQNSLECTAHGVCLPRWPCLGTNVSVHNKYVITVKPRFCIFGGFI
jgi:hypothetical protein